jgi:hypothetical protein
MIIEGDNTEVTETDIPAESGMETETQAPEPTLDEQARSSFLDGVERAEGLREDGTAIIKPENVDALPTAGSPTAAAPAPEVLTPEQLAKKAAEDAIDAELKALHVKSPATTARFKALSAEVRELAPIREVMAKHNITDIKQLDGVMANNDRFIQWEDALTKSTASPEQFGQALNVIHAMNSNDPRALNIVYTELEKQLAAVGQKIGRAAPGADPLAAHPDLKEMVDRMDVTPEVAAQIAQQRAENAMLRQNQDRGTQQQNEQREIQQSDYALNQLSEQLKSSDPHFASKLATLANTGVLDLIKRTVPRRDWPTEVANAYQRLPNPVASPAPSLSPAARPRVGHMPARPGVPAAGMKVEPKSDREAFLMGVAAATD